MTNAAADHSVRCDTPHAFLTAVISIDLVDYGFPIEYRVHMLNCAYPVFLNLDNRHA